MRLRVPFDSPRGEQAWVDQFGPDYWVFPNWRLDINENRALPDQAGMQMFAPLEEPVSKAMTIKKGPGFWIWEIGLK
jgi:putative protease